MQKARQMVTESGGKMHFGEAMKWAAVSQGKAGIGILEMAGFAGTAGTRNKQKKKGGGSED